MPQHPMKPPWLTNDSTPISPSMTHLHLAIENQVWQHALIVHLIIFSCICFHTHYTTFIFGDLKHLKVFYSNKKLILQESLYIHDQA